MTLTVKLFASFRIGRFKQEQRDYPPAVSCRQVISDVGIRNEELGMVLVNGSRVSQDQLLNDGDCLAIFPLLGGG